MVETATKEEPPPPGPFLLSRWSDRTCLFVVWQLSKEASKRRAPTQLTCCSSSVECLLAWGGSRFWRKKARGTVAVARRENGEWRPPFGPPWGFGQTNFGCSHIPSFGVFRNASANEFCSCYTIWRHCNTYCSIVSEGRTDTHFLNLTAPESSTPVS